jgi:hypothetical protein
MNKFEYCIQAYSNPVYMSFDELDQLVMTPGAQKNTKKKSSNINNRTFTIKSDVKQSQLGPPPSKPPPPPPKTPPPIRHKSSLPPPPPPPPPPPV